MKWMQLWAFWIKRIEPEYFVLFKMKKKTPNWSTSESMEGLSFSSLLRLSAKVQGEGKRQKVKEKKNKKDKVRGMGLT